MPLPIPRELPVTSANFPSSGMAALLLSHAGPARGRMLARRAAAHRYNGVNMRWLVAPWPWYVAGPLIGLVVPLLLWLGNKPFGVSSNLRHVCAAVAPCG